MKTGNTLRMARNSLLCFFTALAAGLLVACGGGGGGSGGGSGDGSGDVGGSSGNGTFHAKDWVVGLDYRYLNNGETGKTGAKGAFSFQRGQTVVFSIGQVTLGDFASDAVEDFVTPTRVGDRTRAVNVERLLIALDSDEPDNGVITLDAASAADAAAVWSALTDATATNQFDLDSSNPNHGVSVDRTIPSQEAAERFLTNTNNCAFSGAFEGEWERSGSAGETALVLLAFNQATLTISNPLGAVRDANTELDEITGRNDNNGGALYVNLWKQGGGSETNVLDFGGDSGGLLIGLSEFPVSRVITTEDRELITLTVESYDRMTYTSAEETGEYRRVASGSIRDADYRIAGFYSDEDNGDGEAEIGIYAFSANKGGGSVRPYVGWFSSPLAGTDVYSNIGEGGLDSSLLTYTGTPEDGTMRLTDTEDDQVLIVDFTDEGGYGAFEDASNSAAGVDLSGGWCAL